MPKEAVKTVGPGAAVRAAVRELVRAARAGGEELTGPKVPLKQFTKTVLETAPNEEMTEHLGHEKNWVAEGRESTNVRHGARPETVLTHATGAVDLEVPPGLRRHVRAGDRA